MNIQCHRHTGTIGSNSSAVLENLNDSEDINRVWKNFRVNIRTSAKDTLGLCEMKHQKPWFDEECLQFLGQRKQAKTQWLWDPNQSNSDNLNNVRHDARRHFSNKREEYVKAKIYETETTSKIKTIRDLYRGINYCKNVTSLELI